MTVWNTADKSANIVLSGSNLVATTNSATQGAVRADTSATGKIYFEADLVNITGALHSVGLANATASIAAALGSDTNSVVYQVNGLVGGRCFFNNASLGSNFDNTVAGATVCIAFDSTAKKFWSRIGPSIWNGDVTADPGTGVGGYSVATIGAGPYFPIFGDNGSGGSVTARFGASSFRNAVPTGFSTFDTNVQAFEAVTKMNAYSLTGAPQTAVSVSKMLGYAITRSAGPLFDRRRRLDYLRR